MSEYTACVVSILAEEVMAEVDDQCEARVITRVAAAYGGGDIEIAKATVTVRGVLYSFFS
jgi:hypothetical protein